jgi:hypothetical protein
MTTIAISRNPLARRILLLQVATLGWMLVECSVALTSAWKARSVSLLAFGSDSLIELISAAVVLLQFTAGSGSHRRVLPSSVVRFSMPSQASYRLLPLLDCSGELKPTRVSSAW